MSFAFRLKMAKQKGEVCAKEQGYIALPVDPIAIALKNDIEVRAKPDTAEGVSGMLLRHGNEFCIAYATHIPSEGFQHFSIGHELGHYFLDGHVDQLLKDGVRTGAPARPNLFPHGMCPSRAILSIVLVQTRQSGNFRLNAL
jgi:hypothetical protein